MSLVDLVATVQALSNIFHTQHLQIQKLQSPKISTITRRHILLSPECQSPLDKQLLFQSTVIKLSLPPQQNSKKLFPIL